MTHPRTLTEPLRALKGPRGGSTTNNGQHVPTNQGTTSACGTNNSGKETLTSSSNPNLFTYNFK